ncbi:hypothetical protein, partial [Cupriavidus sp. IDO]|uniref:hypothetical protein n=1 Tax=Cupriavidus sp. IDO TaxID=1539142 RepID=UPI001EE75429
REPSGSVIAIILLSPGVRPPALRAVAGESNCIFVAPAPHEARHRQRTWVARTERAAYQQPTRRQTKKNAAKAAFFCSNRIQPDRRRTSTTVADQRE